MNKIVVTGLVLLVFASIVCGIVAAENSVGPAPKSGECIPDAADFD